MEGSDSAALTADRLSRFPFAPPRHFLLPAILLLLSEEPGYGYGLVRKLGEFRFGQVDRPSVYRALAQLERDQLVESWSAAATAGSARRVYGLTPDGVKTLRAWMAVIQEERLLLDDVLRRYQATGSVDAALACVEGGWVSVLGRAHSPVSPTSLVHRVKHGVRVGERPAASNGPTHPPSGGTPPAPTRFEVVPDRSVLLIEARSTVGPISFGAAGLTGFVEAAVQDGELVPGSRPRASLALAIEELRSGNSVYDAELRRRIDARRYPVVTLELEECVPIGAEDRHRLTGVIDFHGVGRTIEGTVEVRVVDDAKLVVTGEQVLDIRDFDIASPTVMMLRIYPDVRVRLHLEAEGSR